jgi:DNA repair exonuclease SbcCD ATPase subunit
METASHFKATMIASLEKERDELKLQILRQAQEEQLDEQGAIISSLEPECAELKQSALQSSREMEELKQHCELQEASVAELNGHLEAAVEEVELWKKRALKEKEARKSLSAVLNEQKTEADTCQQEFQKTTEEKDATIHRLESALARLEGVETGLQTAELEKERVVQEWQQRVDVYEETEVRKLREEIMRKDMELKEALQQLTDYKMAMANAGAQCGELQQKLISLEHINIGLHQRLDETKAALSSSKGIERDLQAHLEAMLSECFVDWSIIECLEELFSVVKTKIFVHYDEITYDNSTVTCRPGCVVVLRSFV